jgi:uncharacterized protein YegL
MTESLLSQAEFADNPEPRCPVVLLLDTSASMQGAPIQELNGGLRALDETLKADPLAALRVEVAIVTFGGHVQAIDVREGRDVAIPFDAEQAFVTVDAFVPPTLIASGNTPMGEAVRCGLELLRARKEIYKQNGMDYFRPWVFMITDGQPTDVWQPAAQQVRAEEARKGVIFFAVSVQGADMETLSQFSRAWPLASCSSGSPRACRWSRTLGPASKPRCRRWGGPTSIRRTRTKREGQLAGDWRVGTGHVAQRGRRALPGCARVPRLARGGRHGRLGRWRGDSRALGPGGAGRGRSGDGRVPGGGAAPG